MGGCGGVGWAEGGGGGGGAMDVATPVTTPPVTMLVVTATAVCAATAPRGTVLGNRLGGEPSTGLTGAQAVWRTGFWTWVDLTDCMMTGEWVLASPLSRVDELLQTADPPLDLELEQPVLAVGGHMKNTIALAWSNRIVVSPHIGDMGNARSLQGVIWYDSRRVSAAEGTAAHRLLLCRATSSGRSHLRVPPIRD